MYFQLFKTTKEFTWPKEDQISVMERCVWPILKPKTSNSDPEADKIHHMAKIADLFQIWSDQEQYRSLFFLTGHDQNQEMDQNKEIDQSQEIIANWISTMILTSEKIEQGLKDRILNVMCDFVLKLVDSENEIINTDACKEKLLPAITECIQKWLSKGKIKMEKVINSKHLKYKRFKKIAWIRSHHLQLQ